MIQRLSSTKLPEGYLLFIALLSGYTIPFSFTWLSIGLSSIVVIQWIWSHKILGTVLTILFILLNLFMLAALISELREFKSVTTDALELLTVGLSIWLLNLFVSLLLYNIYITKWNFVS